MNQNERDEMLIETHMLAKQTHSAVFGNGKIGMKTKIERMQGAMVVLFPTFTLVIAYLSFCKQ